MAGRPFQKEVPYNKHLPYADRLDDEADSLFGEIKKNLAAAVLQRELRPGVLFWSTRLDHYLSLYGQRFSKEEHVSLVKLYFELLTLPEVDWPLREAFAHLLKALLSKIKRLSRDDLELPWRPLYRVVREMCFCKFKGLGVNRSPGEKQTNILWSTVRRCRTYFPVEATQEMLEEWRPLLCPYDTVSFEAVKLLSNFLPVVLPPEQHHRGFKLWFDELMTLWLSCEEIPHWQKSLLFLFENLGSMNVGYVDWEPYIPQLFTRFLRGLRLPPFNQRSGKAYPAETVANFIVCMLGGSPRTMEHLSDLLQMLDTYYHPSNTGFFQVRLQRFLRIGKYFGQRLRRERFAPPSWLPAIPEEKRLSDADIDEFCRCMKPIVELTMFTRLYGNMECPRLIRDLAQIRPEMFVPLVLDKTYKALETLTEPHQIMTVLPCLVAVSQPLLTGGRSIISNFESRFPEGPTHLLPIIHNLLPGIDPNDFSKTILTTSVMSSFLHLVPIVDCSEMTSKGEMPETKAELCQATGQWEDVILQMLDRCFGVIEQITLDPSIAERQGLDERVISQEGVMGARLSNVIFAVLQQCSPSLFQVALRRLFSFATNHVLESHVAGQSFQEICECACLVNPVATCGLFVPYCCEAIKRLTSEEEHLDEEKADHELVWNLQLLSSVVHFGGVMEQYADQVINALDCTVHLRSKEASRMASNVLANLLYGLVSLYPMEKRSSVHGFEDSPLEYDYFEDWGQSIDVDDVTVSWHIPTESELDFAARLMEHFLDAELATLEAVARGEKPDMTKEELAQRLELVCLAVEGAAAILPDMGNGQPLSPDNVESCVSLDRKHFISMCTTQEIASQKQSHRRLQVATVLHKLLDHILAEREDDTRALQLVMQGYCNVLVDFGILSPKLEGRQRVLEYMLEMTQDSVTGKKKRMRAVLVERIELQHLKRSTMFYHLPKTVAHTAVIDNLLKLSFSAYTSVRVMAQSILSSACGYVYSCARRCLPVILSHLKSDPAVTHEQFKGALYLLKLPAIRRLVICQYQDMMAVWPAIVQADHSEKPSIVTVTQKLVEELLSAKPYPVLKLKFSSSCLSTARSLAESSSLPNIDALMTKGEECERTVTEDNTRAYHELCGTLEEILHSGQVRLRHLLLCTQMLKSLIRHDHNLPPRAVKVFVNDLVNDLHSFRQLSWQAIAAILKQQKVRPDRLKVSPAKMAGLKELDQNCQAGQRKDNQWVCYESSSRPTTKEEWSKFVFVHKPHLGYYCWSEELLVEAPECEQSALRDHLTQLSEEELVFQEAFLSESFVSKLVGFLSLEIQKGKDHFDQAKFDMFKGLFRNYGDKFVPLFRPHLERLAADSQESPQRCAAEIISAIIRSSRHWTFDQLESLKEWLVPLLHKVVMNITVETYIDWGTCFTVATANRDPRCVAWLLELLFSIQLIGENDSFGDATRLLLLELALSQGEWRVCELLFRLEKLLLPQLDNPYQAIRERVGSSLCAVYWYDSELPNTNVASSPHMSNFVASVIPRLQPLLNTTATNGNNSSRHSPSLKRRSPLATPSPALSADNLLQAVPDGGQDFPDAALPVVVDTHIIVTSSPDVDASQEERAVAIRLLKTVMTWILKNIMRGFYTLRPELAPLLPIICAQAGQEDDHELLNLTKTTLKVLSLVLVQPSNFLPILHGLQEAAQCSSWHGRRAGVRFLQVLVFTNRFTITAPEELKLIRTTVLALLEDEQLEVREAAATTLSGLVHGCIIPMDSDLQEHLHQLASTPLPKRRTLAELAANYVPSALIHRHAGVLGMCGLVRAFPYSVPSWMPDILMDLDKHLTDPSPIQGTVREALSEFKRTHYDNWDVHKKSFTDEQQQVLTELLISPSYYA